VLFYQKTVDIEGVLRDRFRDGVPSDCGERPDELVLCSVWISDRPHTEAAGALGEVLLTIETPEEDFRDFELVEEGEWFREWCVPAERLNA
jgi:hypothetical protein